MKYVDVIKVVILAMVVVKVATRVVSTPNNNKKLTTNRMGTKAGKKGYGAGKVVDGR